MTTQEKAKEIYDLFNKLPKSPLIGKFYALLCIDEIINANPTKYIDTVNEGVPLLERDIYSDSVDYWLQVKEELEKM